MNPIGANANRKPRADDVWAVVAHDAGGAEVLSSCLRQHARKYQLSLDGPACKVFERKLGAYNNLPLEVAISGSARLLCGTSWQSDLEIRAIDLARSAGKRSVAWLDHWVNYRERFIRSGQLHLPDEVWVNDPESLQIAQRALPEVPARLTDNPYFADIRAELAAQVRPSATSSGLNVLFVCEPVKETALRLFGNSLHYGYSEEDALDYFLRHVGLLGNNVARILLRPHPSEPAQKYRRLVARYALPISFSCGASLCSEVASADVVVGCASMAMVVGLMAGKRVVSCIPPGGAPCTLPHSAIESLGRLAAARNLGSAT